MSNARDTARFAEVLLKAKLIDEMQLKSALAHSEQWGGSLARAVAELGFAEEDTLVETLSKYMRVPVMHLGNVLKDNTALRTLGVDFCEKHGVFPVSLKDRTLTLAMIDPTDLKVIDDAGSMARVRVFPVMTAETEIRTAIAKHFRGQDLPQPRRKPPRKVEAAEEKLELDFSPSPVPAATPDFTPEDLERLHAARDNQEKVGHILRTVHGLLIAKGVLRRPVT